MADLDTYPQTKSMALMAYVLDIGHGSGPDQETLSALMDAICEDPAERSNLIATLAQSQNPEMRQQIIELLGQRLSRQRTALEIETDHDAVLGVWSQRVCGGALLAGAGAILSGVVTGGLAVVACAVPLVAGTLATQGRMRVHARARAARRACEETARLMDTLRETPTI